VPLPLKIRIYSVCVQHSPNPCPHGHELLCNTCDSLVTMMAASQPVGCMKIAVSCYKCLEASQPTPFPVAGNAIPTPPAGWEEFEFINGTWVGPGSSGGISCSLAFCPPWESALREKLDAAQRKARRQASLFYRTGAFAPTPSLAAIW